MNGYHWLLSKYAWKRKAGIINKPNSNGVCLKVISQAQFNYRYSKAYCPAANCRGGLL